MFDLWKTLKSLSRIYNYATAQRFRARQRPTKSRNWLAARGSLTKALIDLIQVVFDDVGGQLFRRKLLSVFIFPARGAGER